jgi:hypothetical protein
VHRPGRLDHDPAWPLAQQVAGALRRAAKLAGEDAIVDAVYVIEVPPQLSLDAGMEEEERSVGGAWPMSK